MSEWPKWMKDLPPDFWSEEELNRWIHLYRNYFGCQRLKEEKHRVERV